MSRSAARQALDEDPQWWEDTDENEAAKKAVTVAKAIEKAQEVRRRRNLMHARIYSNQDLQSLYDFGVADSYDGGVYLSLNVLQSCSDTMAAKIGRSRPRTQFLTEKANWSLKRTAKQLTQFLDGVFDANDWHSNDGAQSFVDGTLFGSGVAYSEGDESTGDVIIDRVIPDEVLFDETEALYGLKGLWNLFRKKFIHREVLLRLYGGNSPETKKAIKAAAGSKGVGAENYAAAGDMIPVYYAWHRASARGADDGRLIVAMEGENGKLYAGAWKRTRFPFAFWSWQKPIVGVWGRSLAEELIPIQLKINEIIDVIGEGQRLNAIPRTFVQEGALNPKHLNNEIGTIIRTMLPPSQSIVTIPGMGATPEMYQELETWYRRAFEKTGISQLSATAEKPEGISSAVALRELLDREDMRFATVGQRWERFHVDIGMIASEAADELYEKKKGLRIQVPGEKFLQTIDWKKVDIGGSKFSLRAMPSSSMPTTPAAKRQYAQEMFEIGAIDKTTFLQLVELPDTKSEASLILSSIENTDRAIELMLEDGDAQQPEEYSDLVIARARVMQAYLEAKNDGAEESVPENLELLRRYIDRCTSMLEEQQPALPDDTAPAQPGDMEAAAAQGGPILPPAPPAPPPLDPMLADVAPDLAAQAVPPVPPVPPVM